MGAFVTGDFVVDPQQTTIEQSDINTYRSAIVLQRIRLQGKSNHHSCGCDLPGVGDLRD